MFNTNFVVFPYLWGILCCILGLDLCLPPLGERFPSLEMEAGDLTMADIAAMDPGLRGTSIPCFKRFTGNNYCHHQDDEKG